MIRKKYIGMIAILSLAFTTGCVQKKESVEEVPFQAEATTVETVEETFESKEQRVSVDGTIETETEEIKEAESDAIVEEQADAFRMEYEPCEGKKYALQEKMIDEEHFLVSLVDGNQEVVQEMEVNTAYNNPINCGAFALDDINMDGYLDVPLVTAMGNVNIAYDVYLWNPEQEKLEKCEIGEEFCGVYTLHPEEKTLDLFVHDSASHSYYYRYEWSDFRTCTQVKYMDFDYDSDPASADWDRKVYMTLGNQDDNQVVIDDTFVTAEEDNERMDLYWRLFNLFPTTITTKGNTTVYEGYYMEAGKKVSCSFTVDEEEHKLK